MTTYAAPGSQLQSAINASIAAGQAGFTVAPGTYTFDTELRIANAVNWTLQATGSEFIFPCGVGVIFVGCEGVTTHGVTIDYAPKCYAQGKVVAWQEGSHSPARNATVDMELADGFPVPLPSVTPIFHASVVKVIYWNATSQLMSTWQSGVNNWLAVEQVTATRFRAVLPPQGQVPPAGSQGVLVTFSPRVGFTHDSLQSSRMQFYGTRIYGGGNMIYTEFGGAGGNLYSNVSITRRPGTAGLLSGNADAFHSNCVGLGPEVTASELAFTGDDLMNVHNKIGLVWGTCEGGPGVCLDVIDTSGTTIQSLLRARQGDTLSVWDRVGLKRLGNLTLLQDAVAETNQSVVHAAHEAPKMIVNPPYSSHIRPFSVFVVRLQVEASTLPPDTTRFQLVQFDKFSGNGARIHGNHFHDSFDTAFKFKASHSSYTNNRVERARGVHVAAEEYWLEGSLGLHNITVADNIFVDCGTDKTSVINKGPDATDITITNNTIVLGPV